MKPITLQDVNNAILGTDIEIIDFKTITNLSDLINIPSHLYGVYVINLKYNESYIGMSKKGMDEEISKTLKGIKSRLLRHSCESWHKAIIESINIFVTEKSCAHLLEKIMIKTFEPELNKITYNKFKFDFRDEEDDDGLLVTDYESDPKYKYEIEYGNSKFINWIKKQKDRYDYIRNFAIDLLYDSKENGIKFKNIFELSNYLESIDFDMSILNDAYNEYKYIHSTDYRKQSENFGTILINSINPELSSQLTTNKTFGFNYRILCKKYDEIRIIKDRNISNAWEECTYNERKNDDILNNDISYWNEHTKKHQAIYKLKNEKIGIIRKNYASLLLELNTELETLHKKHGKEEDYTINSDYHFKIKDDINFYIKFENPELLSSKH